MSSQEYNKRKAAGLCYLCGVLVKNGKALCEECNKKNNEKCKKRSEKLKEAGLCVRCGKNIPEEGKLSCNDCNKRQNETNYKRRKTRIGDGLCQFCDEPAIGGLTFCEIHLKRTRGYNMKFRQNQSCDAGVYLIYARDDRFKEFRFFWGHSNRVEPNRVRQYTHGNYSQGTLIAKSKCENPYKRKILEALALYETAFANPHGNYDYEGRLDTRDFRKIALSFLKKYSFTISLGGKQMLEQKELSA